MNTQKHRTEIQNCCPEIRKHVVVTIQRSFLCTDWDIFFQDSDINMVTDENTVYVSFCFDSEKKKSRSLY